MFLMYEMQEYCPFKLFFYCFRRLSRVLQFIVVNWHEVLLGYLVHPWWDLFKERSWAIYQTSPSLSDVIGIIKPKFQGDFWILNENIFKAPSLFLAQNRHLLNENNYSNYLHFLHKMFTLFVLISIYYI